MKENKTNNLEKKKITMISTFSGVGMQERGVENTNLFDLEVLATCEMDTNAIISYAAIHNNLTPELIDTYENYPSREEMANNLTRMNIGYDFKKKKPYDWHKVARSKDNKKLLQKIWLACKLNKNVGDICKVDSFPKCDLFTFSFPCFVEGTLVLTKDGYKEIQDIEVGDYVLTHTNSWQKVIRTMTNEADRLLSINCMPSEKIYCTPNHPFYVRKLSHPWDNEKRRHIRKFSDPKWINAKDLTSEYYVGTAINQIEKLPKWDGIEKNTSWGHSIHENKLARQMELEDFWYIIGRYIGDGWIRTQSGIIICANQEEVGQIIPYLERLKWGYSLSNETTVVKIHIPFQEIGEYCLRFGKGAANKRLTSDILNLPVKLLKSFIKGYLDSDGSFTQNRYKIGSVSRKLIYETAQCIMKAYHVPVSIYFTKRNVQTIIEGRTVNQRDSYELAFKLDKNIQDKAFYENGYIWSPIKEINTEEQNILVYNLEVENDNSYQVQNIICHNCTDLSVAGKQAGMVKGETRSGLVYEVIRILHNMKETNTLPEFMIMENVDALVNKKNLPQYEEINKEFEEIGYGCLWNVENAKYTGIPQNRNRVYGLYYLKDKYDLSDFQFPKKFDNGIRLKDVLEDNVDEKYYITNKKAKALIEELILNGTLEDGEFWNGSEKEYL